MEFRVLAIGDVVGENGLDLLVRRLRPLKREKQVDFTVVNGENAAGLGLFPAQAEEIFDAGADVITLGNHTFDKHQIRPMLEENRYLLRPANFTARAPGGESRGVTTTGRPPPWGRPPRLVEKALL